MHKIEFCVIFGHTRRTSRTSAHNPFVRVFVCLCASPCDFGSYPRWEGGQPAPGWAAVVRGGGSLGGKRPHVARIPRSHSSSSLPLGTYPAFPLFLHAPTRRVFRAPSP